MIFLRESAVNKALGGKHDAAGDQQGDVRGGRVSAPRGSPARCGARSAGSRGRSWTRRCRSSRSRCGRAPWPRCASRRDGRGSRSRRRPRSSCRPGVARAVAHEAERASTRRRCARRCAAALERAGALSGGPVSLVRARPRRAPRARARPRACAAARAEREETVRFRLHKALPFDVRAARLAWRRARADAGRWWRSRRDEVVRGYEERARGARLRAGPRRAGGPRARRRSRRATPRATRGLLVNWDDGYVSFLVLPRTARRCWCARCRGEDEPGGGRAARGAARCSSTASGSAGAASPPWSLRAGALDPAEASEVARARARRRRRGWCEPWAALGDAEDGAEAQAVAGAAACVLRRAA